MNTTAKELELELIKYHVIGSQNLNKIISLASKLVHDYNQLEETNKKILDCYNKRDIGLYEK